MKSNKLVKFTMTAICMAVLSACGSSSDDNPSVAATTNTSASTSTSTSTTTTTTTPTDTTTTTPTDTTTATNATGEDNVDVAAAFAEGQKSNVGAKNVVLNKSNLTLNTHTSTDKTAVADTATAMNMQLHPSLDTVVVVEASGENAKDAKRGYLEDFDFRGNQNARTGEYDLFNIYLQTGETGVADDSGTKTTGTKADFRAKSETKTDTAGLGVGKALVYQDKRVNYSTYEGAVVKADGTVNNDDLIDSTGAITTNAKARVLKDTVAEMYGHLTFAEGAVADRYTANTNPQNVADQANLPLAATDKGHSDQLNYVQYGRVTSHLDKHQVGDFKDGVVDNTFVVNYGLYGQDGTENNYIYRGVGNTTAAELAALGSKTFEYRGHAVAYGLNDKFKDFETTGIPNAVGNQYAFVSGNHVKATVDTAENTVKGSIYNVWYDNFAKELKEGKLVGFNGTLHKNGGITGTSTNTESAVLGKDNKEGTFAATLFGDKAQELGGVVASKDKTAGKAWGAVFGANRAKESTPVVTPGWGASTNVGK